MATASSSLVGVQYPMIFPATQTSSSAVRNVSLSQPAQREELDPVTVKKTLKILSQHQVLSSGEPPVMEALSFLTGILQAGDKSKLITMASQDPSVRVELRQVAKKLVPSLQAPIKNILHLSTTAAFQAKSEEPNTWFKQCDEHIRNLKEAANTKSIDRTKVKAISHWLITSFELTVNRTTAQSEPISAHKFDAIGKKLHELQAVAVRCPETHDLKIMNAYLTKIMHKRTIPQLPSHLKGAIIASSLSVKAKNEAQNQADNLAIIRDQIKFDPIAGYACLAHYINHGAGPIQLTMQEKRGLQNQPFLRRGEHPLNRLRRDIVDNAIIGYQKLAEYIGDDGDPHDLTAMEIAQIVSADHRHLLKHLCFSSPESVQISMTIIRQVMQLDAENGNALLIDFIARGCKQINLVLLALTPAEMLTIIKKTSSQTLFFYVYRTYVWDDFVGNPHCEKNRPVIANMLVGLSKVDKALAEDKIVAYMLSLKKQSTAFQLCHFPLEIFTDSLKAKLVDVCCSDVRELCDTEDEADAFIDSLPNLKVLTVGKNIHANCSKLESLYWYGIEQTKFKKRPFQFNHLTYLYIYGCSNHKIPSIPTLQTLKLENCPNIERVPSGLSSLDSLFLRNCPNLSKLPDDIDFKKTRFLCGIAPNYTLAISYIIE